MIYIIYIILAIVAFLVVLNGFLRGGKKVQIDALLSILLLALVVAAFAVGGWKLGLLAIPIGFVSAVIALPLAARIAAKLYAIHTDVKDSKFVNFPPRTLQRISKQLGAPIDLERFFDETQTASTSGAEDALLAGC